MRMVFVLAAFVARLLPAASVAQGKEGEFGSALPMETDHSRKQQEWMEIITDKSGSFNFEDEVSGETEVRRLWLLELEEEEEEEEEEVEAVMHMIDLNVTALHLPSLTTIHHTPAYNYTSGDFLLVGAGRSLFGGSKETMFYGVRNTVGRVRVAGPVGHVYLHLFPSSPPLLHNVSLQIDYALFEERIATPPPTPEPPVSDIYNYSAWIDLNGISPAVGWKEEYTRGVKRAVAAIVQQHYRIQLHYSINITEEDVSVVRSSTCLWKVCLDHCTAYNVTAWARNLTDGEEWLIGRDLLQRLFTDPAYHHHWSENLPGTVEVCMLGASVLGLRLWVALAVMVVLVVAVNVVACLVQTASKNRIMNAKFKKILEDREGDLKRKVSGTISMLGFTSASLASRVSQRMANPFRSKSDSDSENDAEGNVEDSAEYEPDAVDLPCDPPSKAPGQVTLQLHPRSFVNKAFVDDEKASPPQDASVGNFSDADSDESDIIHFQKNTSKVVFGSGDEDTSL